MLFVFVFCWKSFVSTIRRVFGCIGILGRKHPTMNTNGYTLTLISQVVFSCHSDTLLPFAAHHLSRFEFELDIAGYIRCSNCNDVWRESCWTKLSLCRWPKHNCHEVAVNSSFCFRNISVLVIDCYVVSIHYEIDVFCRFRKVWSVPSIGQMTMSWGTPAQIFTAFETSIEEFPLLRTSQIVWESSLDVVT